MSVADKIAVIAAIVAVVAAIIAAMQAAAAKTANAFSHSTLLSNLESKVQDTSQAIIQLSANLRKAKKGNDPDEIEFAELAYKAGIEIHLNSLERIAQETTKGVLKESELKVEYRDAFREAVRKYPEFFATGTPHTGIKDLVDKWTR